MVPATVGWLLIGCHFLLFSQFFPNAQGKLGHDYQYNLPLLLDGYYWFLHNGCWSLPWFTPSFCGGMPLMANPATFFFSTAQWFTFVTDPVHAVRLTLLLFAGLGFWGMYCLLRTIFRASRWSALLAGGFFLFNGLYAWRMVVGHLEFHAFMLTPFIAYFLLRVEAAGRLRAWGGVRNAVCVGVMLAYAFMSGMTQLMVPVLIAVMVIAALAKLTPATEVDGLGFVLRLAGAGVVALGLSAAKLAAALAFLGNFPRDTYLLPGVEGGARLLAFILQVLTVGGAQVDAESVIANSQWSLGRHEFEFGLTVAPFLLMALGLAVNGGWHRLGAWLLSRRQLPALGLCLLLLAIPVALNSYSPAWNQFLKTVPFIRNLSNFIRWFIIYIPCLVILAALALEHTPLLLRLAPYVTALSLAWVVVANVTTDATYYHDQPYDPAPVVAAYWQTREQGEPPVIATQVASLDENGQPALTLARNDVLIHGQSQILCYEPMFGFRLEFFPFKGLRPGPSLAAADGVLNVKNPACYLYPHENGCTPGDPFRQEEEAEARRFISFHPFAYRVSGWQAIADWVNRLTLLALPFLALGYGWAAWRSRRASGEGR
jgi:hypothetical protein